jgi:DNA-binding winged helix-turn-helix (wHTH) protein
LLFVNLQRRRERDSRPRRWLSPALVCWYNRLLAVQILSQRCQADHHRARFGFGVVRCPGFDNLENAALRDAEKLGGLLDCQRGRAAFRASRLRDRRGLTNDKSPFGNNQLFKFSLDLHSVCYRKQFFAAMMANIGFSDWEVWIFFGLFLDFFWIVVESQPIQRFMTKGDTQKTTKLYRFGAFRLDAAERRLWREDDAVHLKPKQFDLLLYFVENAGRVTKKSELLDAIWENTFVEETTLARNISWLRQKLGEHTDGESFIETVPKLGYRFTAQVERSDENLLVIEEETIEHTRGEEIITFNEAELTKNKETKPAKSFAVSIVPVLLVVFGLVAGGGFFLYQIQQKQPAESRVNAASSRKSLKESQQINIGSIIHLQNRYPNDGSYLDAWGAVWSKPEFNQVPTETSFVSTHDDPNRENGSGSWEIVSASGKENGEPLVVGDRIHLRNMYPNAGYLDACGWVEHLRVFENYSDQSGAVFTTRSPNRDNGTGVWIVRSAAEEDGTPVLEGDSIAIESTYFINDQGKNRISGFLNVAGKVKDIPSFNDYDGSRLVFTRNISYDQSIPDIWTITISKAILK